MQQVERTKEKEVLQSRTYFYTQQQRSIPDINKELPYQFLKKPHKLESQQLILLQHQY